MSSVSEQAATAENRAIRVVIAEDSPTQAVWLEHSLLKRGCSVTVARDGEAALRIVRAEPPDLLISDVVMPKMDGYGLCRAIKADPATANVRVVLATAQTDPADVLRGLAAGADDFLTKPYGDEDLDPRLFPRRLTITASGAVTLDYRGEEHVVGADPARGIGFMLSAIEEADKRNKQLDQAKRDIQEAMTRVIDLEAGLRRLMEDSPQAICVAAPDGAMRYANHAAEALLDQRATDVRNPQFPFPLTPGSHEITLSRPDGSSRISEMHVTTTTWQGEPCLVASFWDITENALLREELRSLSLTDELTGLYNRRGFRFLAEEQVGLARRRGARAGGLALLYTDVDGMKTINDDHGHEAGDAALVAVARSMRSTCRETDIVARLGGDEFAALLVDYEPSEEKAVQSRLDEALRAANAANGAPYRLSLSIGVARVPAASEWTIDDLLRAADERMYIVKKGRARRGAS